ncbi:peptide-methionine (S)-S-oxide reductase MsrA [Haloferax larsenii]|uniref:Peptide methionine sulfoxide reductase MsrA n=1 Tax=Haloferax larsenii TaxID=302484 RepID=A0A1H7Q0G3_HALLR|nr:peptide-methionine (S)-S-oxide reductase MsrA [Haloferax larsenii]SEL41463.1 peptide-methionine (S)-S-oxide reductase [Haloferax larsenii]
MTTTETATFGGGCFWCIEAAFKELDGITDVTSGYAGGDVPNPSYEEVCNGTTGHAEVVRVTFETAVLDYEDLLEVFFTVHDPTTVDRQGPDVGSQYRSAIYTESDEQQRLAEQFVDELESAEAFDDPIVTKIEPLDTFYEAEAYHQDYFEKNPNQPYCAVNVAPKVKKVREKFADKLAN